MAHSAKIQHEQELISLKNLKTIIALVLVVCIGAFIGFTDIIHEPSTNATSYYEASLRGMADYYFGIGDMDAYNKTMKELEKYLSDNADQKNEIAAPTTEPETPEIFEPSETPTFQHYADVSDNAWYAEAVNSMTEGRLLKGYDDGLFHPDDVITAGQLATIICRIGGENPGNDKFKPYYEDGVLIEKPVHWASYAISRTSCTYYYLIHQDRADFPVLRAEAFGPLTNIAQRISAYKDSNGNFKQVSEKVWTLDDIPDVDRTMIISGGENLSAWGVDRVCAGSIMYDYVTDAYNLGIAHGVDNLGTCKPFEPVTRAELCQMLYNMGIVRENCVSLWGNTAYYYEGQINPGPRQTTAD